MVLGVILILAGSVLMLIGARRMVRWQGQSDDADIEADWFDGSTRGRGDPKYPGLYFLGTVLGPLLGGAILVVFGLVSWGWGD